ncbi:MAG: hypothetical protein ACI9WU_003319 [Myxococcota bacterium]
MNSQYTGFELEVPQRIRRSDFSVIREYNRFQLEATKLGRTVVFQVTVFEKTERNRRKLFAETQCSDPLHFIIQFIIREAPTFDVLLEKFVSQLLHRGFSPARYRVRGDGKWQAWSPIEAEPVNPAAHQTRQSSA